MAPSSCRIARIASLVLVLAGCGQAERVPPWPNFSGDPARGARLMGRAGCGQCHEIPGIENARGKVGPPLAHFGTRTTVAGLLPNTAAGLTRWIAHPQQVLPGNVMPDMGFSQTQARDIAAYLHTLD